MKIREIIGEDAYANTLSKLNEPKKKEPSAFRAGISKGREKAARVAGKVAQGWQKFSSHPLVKPK